MPLDCEFEQPDVRPVAKDLYRVAREYCYCWMLGDVQNRIRIPAGYTHDGASVPRIAWTLSGVRPDGLIRAAALVHDYVYGFAGRLPVGDHEFKRDDGSWAPVQGRWRRRDTDRLFARMMREADVPRFQRRLAYRVVRLFGGFGWNT